MLLKGGSLWNGKVKSGKVVSKYVDDTFTVRMKAECFKQNKNEFEFFFLFFCIYGLGNQLRRQDKGENYWKWRRTCTNRVGCVPGLMWQ